MGENQNVPTELWDKQKQQKCKQFREKLEVLL